jgi:eukaryotic-like serine/threonine-protein kinase
LKKNKQKGGFVMMNLVGQEVGDYKLLRLLGQGSSARVYLGEHKYHRSHVAVKILETQRTKGWKTRGYNEVYMLSHITHPHIIRLREYGTEDNIQFLVLDLATQGTLFDLLTQNVSISRVTTCVRQIASALQYLHRMHIIHRDIKPTNVLVELSGNVLLADFELATDHRNCRSKVATPAYAAPEQTQGQPCPASDQYALGVIVYQWLCGELPFRGTPAEMAIQHRNASPPPLRDKVPTLPYAVEQVVLTALAKDPKSRFIDIRTFAEFLQRACLSSSYKTPSQSLAANTASDFTETDREPE